MRGRRPARTWCRLPRRVPGNERREDEPLPPGRWAGVAEPGSALERGLDDIVAVDRSFDSSISWAARRAAYEMIVTAFANGDRRTLRNLLAKDVYDGFVAAIADREAPRRDGRIRASSPSTRPRWSAPSSRTASSSVTVRFVSQLVTVTRDKAGAVIDGNPDQVTDVTDIWTFSRDLAVARSELEADRHRGGLTSAAMPEPPPWPRCCLCSEP